MGMRCMNAGEFQKDPKIHLNEAIRLVQEAVKLIEAQEKEARVTTKTKKKPKS